MLKFLPNHVKKALQRNSAPIEVPFVQGDDRGIVAVIDISGFTGLSTRLATEYGSDGAAKLKDAINSPFDKIIKRTYARSGSIVKFAGDSALVCWSETEASESRKRNFLLESFICCLELLEIFKCDESETSDDAKQEDRLGVHIGVAFGRISHIHLGERAADQLPQAPRREYLVAGEAVSQASVLLDRGKRGELRVSTKYWEALVGAFSSLRVAQFKQLDQRASIHSIGHVCIADEEVSTWHRIERSTSNLLTLRHKLDQPPSAEQGVDYDSAMQYIESSVARYLVEEELNYGETSPPTKSKATINDLPAGEMNAWTDAYSDLRQVAIAFFRFADVHLDHDVDFLASSPTVRSESTMPASDEVLKAQFFAETAMACVRERGGSLRQLNFDDKSFTALAVWGLRGSAHQRAEAGYALHACLDFAERVGRRRERERKGGGFESNDDGDGRRVPLAAGSVIIGVTTGTVYAGLIGNKLRMDGTVLGSAVNLAARLMCINDLAPADEVEWLNVWIFCDQSTFLACKDLFEFGPSPRHASFKGFKNQLPVYAVLRRADDTRKSRIGKTIEFAGREAEITEAEAAVKRWKSGTSNERLLVTGRSGLGKSTLADQIRIQLDEDPLVLPCSSTADEMMQKSSFAFLGATLLAIASQLRLCGVNTTDLVEKRKDRLSRSQSNASLVPTSNFAKVGVSRQRYPVAKLLARPGVENFPRQPTGLVISFQVSAAGEAPPPVG
ncbi:hypothetical protein DFJ73DRAFT_339886 [Zopfochytrium polystomum]|nr:hypothetical protein DFJ73DRAFT_339886 [Zopfochytrium polystomum]